MELYTDKYASPLGQITLISDRSRLLALLLPGQTSKLTQSALVSMQTEPIRYTKKWLDDYFAGKRPAVDPAMVSARGTDFQMQVWQILTRIPYGQTVTYGQIAEQICRQNQIPKMSAQAVGQAVGSNPVSIMIPCHRVVGAGGKLTGYAGGIRLKQMLLRHEGWYSEKTL